MSDEKFSYRKFRNTSRAYEFDETPSVGNFCYKLEYGGVVPDTNDKIKVNAEGDIVFDGKLYPDDLLAFARNWMKSILPDDEGNTEAAIKAVNMAILLMDNRAMLRHGYANAPHEHKDQPYAKKVCERWERVAEIARNQVFNNRWGIDPRIYRKIRNDGFNFVVDGKVYTAQGYPLHIIIAEGVDYRGKNVPENSDEYKRLMAELCKLRT